MLSFWRFTDRDVFDVASSENNVFIDFFSWRSRSVCGPVFSTKGPHLGQRHGGVLGVDGVEDALIADLRLGDQADLAADVGGPRAHGAAGPGPGRCEGRRPRGEGGVPPPPPPAHAHCGAGSPAAPALYRAEGDALGGRQRGGVLRPAPRMRRRRAAIDQTGDG